MVFACDSDDLVVEFYFGATIKIIAPECAKPRDALAHKFGSLDRRSAAERADLKVAAGTHDVEVLRRGFACFDQHFRKGRRRDDDFGFLLGEPIDEVLDAIFAAGNRLIRRRAFRGWGLWIEKEQEHRGIEYAHQCT
jgi:hypothetical protein